MLTIHTLLRSLGITANYRGYHITIIACELLMKNEMLFLRITKGLYPEVARKLNCRTITVERNIRTIIYRAWDIRRERLCEIAGIELTEPPKVVEFLDMLISYVNEHNEEQETKENAVAIK